MKLCSDCRYRHHVHTTKIGREAFCMHPRSIDVRDSVAMTCYGARDAGKPCGPEGHLHSSNETRSGYMSPSQWRTTQ